MKKHIFDTLVFIISFFFLAVCITGCDNKETINRTAQKYPIIEVKESTVQSFPSPHPFEVMATVRAVERANIAARISGNIISLPIETGQKVKKGALLVQLDDAAPTAYLHEAQVILAQNERNLSRETRLLKKQAATSASVKTLQESVRIARAKVLQAETTLQFAAIRAPFAGLVTEKLVSNGDLVMPGIPLLTIENPEKLEIVVNVPEMRLPLLEKEMDLIVHIPSVGFSNKGKIVEIAPAVNPLSHTAQVKLSLLNNEKQALISGMFAKVQLPNPTDTIDSLFIDKKALYKYGQIEKVFIAKNNKAMLRIVRSGQTITKNGIEMVEILSGLEANEKVLLTNKNLHNLQPVRIIQ